MQVFCGYREVPDAARGAVAALGNFDGVHLGHAALLAIARQEAARRGAPLAVVTFEPHPRRFFDPGSHHFRLTTRETKLRLLAEQGVDTAFELPFTAEFAALTAQQFRNDALASGLGIVAAVAGEGFRFGQGRIGTMASLEEGSPFPCVPVPAFRDERGIAVSSSRVREALVAGEPREARALLGRCWEISYRVEAGDRRGRELGFATANGTLGELLRPAFGIYAVTAHLPDGRNLPGVANIGIRPMWRTTQPLVETHIFDFAEMIYGTEIRIELVEYLRPERAFADAQTLITQINIDCAMARAALTGNG